VLLSTTDKTDNSGDLHKNVVGLEF